MTISNNRIIADSDKRLLHNNIISKEAWLSPNDSIENWKEISLEEAQALQAKHLEDVKEKLKKWLR